MEQVGRAQQPVAQVRAGFDVVAQVAQALDARPDGGAANPQFAGKIGPGNRPAGRLAQGA